MTLRIVRGHPTAEEIAAVTVVLLAAAGSGAGDKVPPKRGRWADPAHRLRAPLHPGPDAWIRSAQPR